MHSNAYTYRFLIILTGLAAFLLALASSGLKERQDFNRALDTKKNILKSVGIYEKAMSPKEVEESYKKFIFVKYITSSGEFTDDPEAGMKIFEYKDGGEVKGYILPVSGKGLWSTIKGFLALEPDKNTIRGITFYEHGETPGLGGEIEKDWFTGQFAGKKIFDEQGNLVSVTVNKGQSPDNDEHHVDGISGATLTTKGLNSFLYEDLKEYENFFKKNI